MDSVNSTTFIKRPICMTETQEKLLYTKELLSGRIFLGCYQERRYVTTLKEYRDVIIINSEENELQSDLDRLKQKWLGVNNIKWVGITGPDAVDLPKAHCFWVKLTNLAFGHYWFQIKSVKLVKEEIVFHLKCIRKFQAFQPASVTGKNDNMILQNRNEESEPSASLFLSPYKINWEFVKQAALHITERCSEAGHIVMSYLTWMNLLHFMKVTCALTIAFASETIICFGHLGEFILKLIRELSLLINAITPIVIHLIDFFSKIIGGFFILLLGLLGRNVYRFNTQPNRNSDFCSADHNRTPAIDWRKRNKILRKELLSNEFR